MNVPSAGSLPPTLWDAMLRVVPLNLLFLDSDFVCRYAAPIGDGVLGRRTEELPGLHAAEILPPARKDLGPVLRRAAQSAISWRNPEYRFTHAVDGRERLFCWSIRVDPVRTVDARGVLITWSDLNAEEERRLLGADAYRREAQERNAALVQTFSDLRNAITPLSGYLQLIVRRPETLRGRSPAELIAGVVLPRVGDLLAITERLRRPPIHASVAPGDDGSPWPSPDWAGGSDPSQPVPRSSRQGTRVRGGEHTLPQ